MQIYIAQYIASESQAPYSVRDWPWLWEKIQNHSVALRKAGNLTVSDAKCVHFLVLHHGSQNSCIDRNEEITSLLTYVYIFKLSSQVLSYLKGTKW